MENVKISNKDQIVMGLVHYFVTKENYTPIVVKGTKDEVWLENLNAKYKIIRINNNYIHNNEQHNFDLSKYQNVLRQIKKRTFSFKMSGLNICLGFADRVDITQSSDIKTVSIKTMKDLKTNQDINLLFPELSVNLIKRSKTIEDVQNVTEDINTVTKNRNIKFQEVFSPKSHIVTNIIIAICVILYILTLLSNNYILYFGANLGEAVISGEYYRLITCIFLHASLIHLFVNMYSLKILGKELESIIGQTKFLYIFFLSGLSGSLLSILINGTSTFSVGASGAIFGLGAALIYFGYQYRVYLNKVLYSQLVPVLLINIMIGFTFTGIDNAAHIGGLIGGYFAACSVGVTGEVDPNEQKNGIIATIVFLAFCVYMLIR